MKTNTIEKILFLTKNDPKYFDYLSDQSETYLKKLLTVVKLLK